MKFQPDTLSGTNVVTRQEAGRVWVGKVEFAHAVLVPWTGAVLDWQAAGFEALGPSHFERVAALAPEVVIFGSGARLRFPPPAWLQALYARRIGVETMDTPAACRTYNVLASEGRSVIAALLVGEAVG